MNPIVQLSSTIATFQFGIGQIASPPFWKLLQLAITIAKEATALLNGITLSRSLGREAQKSLDQAFKSLMSIELPTEETIEFSKNFLKCEQLLSSTIKVCKQSLSEAEALSKKLLPLAPIPIEIRAYCSELEYLQTSLLDLLDELALVPEANRRSAELAPDRLKSYSWDELWQVTK